MKAKLGNISLGGSLDVCIIYYAYLGAFNIWMKTRSIEHLALEFEGNKQPEQSLIQFLQRITSINHDENRLNGDEKLFLGAARKYIGSETKIPETVSENIKKFTFKEAKSKINEKEK